MPLNPDFNTNAFVHCVNFQERKPSLPPSPKSEGAPTPFIEDCIIGHFNYLILIRDSESRLPVVVGVQIIQIRVGQSYIKPHLCPGLNASIV